MASAFLSHRKQLKYGLLGLTHREEFLLKIILGMLNAKTHDEWMQDQDFPDMWILSDSVKKIPSMQMAETIRLSTLQNFGTGFENGVPSTNTRFDADKIEVALNLAGETLRQRMTQKYSETAQVVLFSETAGRKKYRLKRWPANELMPSISHNRVAALLLGMPLTMDSIVLKSSCDKVFCEAFVTKLINAGYIAEQPDIGMDPLQAVSNLSKKASSNSLSAKKTGIFSKIRRRLAIPILRR